MRSLKAIISLLFLCILFFNGCSESISNLDSDPKYSVLLGKQLVTQTDLFVLKQKKSDPNCQLYVPGTFGIRNIKDIAAFPYKENNKVYYGVLRKGSIFKIIGFEEHKNVEQSIVNCLVEIVSSGEFKEYKVNASMLTDIGRIPKFEEKYAVEVSTI